MKINKELGEVWGRGSITNLGTELSAISVIGLQLVFSGELLHLRACTVTRWGERATEIVQEMRDKKEERLGRVDGMKTAACLAGHRWRVLRLSWGIWLWLYVIHKEKAELETETGDTVINWHTNWTNGLQKSVLMSKSIMLFHCLQTSDLFIVKSRFSDQETSLKKPTVISS